MEKEEKVYKVIPNEEDFEIGDDNLDAILFLYNFLTIWFY